MTQLTARATHFIGNDADLDNAPEERVLRVPGVIWRKAVGLAETRGFRAQRTFLTPVQAVALANSLSDALAEPRLVTAGPRASSSMTPRNQLLDFFEVPNHRRELLR